MSEYDNFLIASLDFHRLDLSGFRLKTLANITGFSLLSGRSINDELDIANVASSLGYEQLHRRLTGKTFTSFSSSPVYHTEKVHSFTVNAIVTNFFSFPLSPPHLHSLFIVIFFFVFYFTLYF